SFSVGNVVPIPTLPFCFITNLLNPEEDAVKRSPFPLLSTTSPANEEFADTEATDVVPAKAALPVTLKSAEAEDWPPISKSCVIFPSKIAPDPVCQMKLAAADGHVAELVTIPLVVFTQFALTFAPATPLILKLLLPPITKLISPVEAVPRLNVSLFVVPIFPKPSSVRALFAVFAAILAVGVPAFTLMKANLALLVALLPRSKSLTDVNFGERALPTLFQKLTPGIVVTSVHCGLAATP